MKYIKTFEEINLKYNIGDYVILDMDKIKTDLDDYELKNNWRPKYPIDNIVQIVKFREFTEEGKQQQYYHVEFYNGMDDDFYLLTDNAILRKATTEEIKDFKLKREIDPKITKFNI